MVAHSGRVGEPGGGARTTTTDGFGDFWFEGLDVGTYSLEIAAPGFRNKTFATVDSTDNANLGDIPLET